MKNFIITLIKVNSNIIVRLFLFLKLKIVLIFISLILMKTFFRKYIYHFIYEIAKYDIILAQTIYKIGIKKYLSNHSTNNIINKNPKISIKLYTVEETFYILDKTLSLIESERIRPFLCFGTLLGMIREKSFMEHDLDLDIGILTSEANSSDIKNILKKFGYKIIHYEKGNWPCRLKVYYKKFQIIIDFIFFHKENNHLLTYVKYANNYIIRKRKSFNLVQKEFLGRKVWIPENPEEFLKENYKNWEKKSDYSHFLLTSPFTDFSLPVVHYTLFEQMYFELSRDNINKFNSILQIAKNNSIDLQGVIES